MDVDTALLSGSTYRTCCTAVLLHLLHLLLVLLCCTYVLLCTATSAVQANDIYEYEMALLSNLTPEQAEEALELIPSLKVGG